MPVDGQKQQSASWTVPRFAGERVFSLALRGNDKFILRLMCYLAAAMPVPVLVVFWYALGRYGGSPFPISGKSWVMLSAMMVWSVMTIWLLRTTVRYRQRTTITLNIDGVRYRAPKVGLFPEREVSIRWEQIESIRAKSRKYPTLITVSSPTDGFVFDRRYAREVLRHPIQGAYLPVAGGNNLLHDLLEYSGRAVEATSTRTSMALKS